MNSQAAFVVKIMAVAEWFLKTVDVLAKGCKIGVF
jgi:hypothetical protein